MLVLFGRNQLHYWRLTERFPRHAQWLSVRYGYHGPSHCYWIIPGTFEEETCTHSLPPNGA